MRVKIPTRQLKSTENTESQTSRDKNSNPNDAITIQNDQTSDQTVEINKQSKFVDKTSTEKGFRNSNKRKEITNSTSTSIKEKIEESSPVTKEEKQMN